MDNDSLRRGMPTLHIKYNEATAILAGDALLTLGFETLLNINIKNIEKKLEIFKIISDAAGYRKMIEGQMQDIVNEKKSISIKNLKKMHSLKTGALIKASVKTGGIIGGADPYQLSCLDKYAENIGLAFQVADDILNVVGDSSLMGKKTGTDASLNKNTFPSILGIDKSKLYAEKLVENAISALKDFDQTKIQPLTALAEYIIKRDR
jgi:geranylgeranyl diphosphate synthase type II